MSDGKWPVDKAVEWYQTQPWLRGCNFIPSTAINQLEMWHAVSSGGKGPDPRDHPRGLGVGNEFSHRLGRLGLDPPVGQWVMEHKCDP